MEVNMGIKVVKFGGSSLANAPQMKKVADIVNADSGRKYIVVSAPGKRFGDDIKVTDMLYRCFEVKDNKVEFDKTFSSIKERYNDILKELGVDYDLTAEFKVVEENILNSKTPDYAASRGEYLNALVFSKYMNCDFLDAAGIIIFNENGVFDSKATYPRLKEKLSGKDKVVIPGFYGSFEDGTIKTFSRGGSDITGSIVSRAVNADLYENWTDVSGMLMADPRLVENPVTIDLVTYKELRELSYMGAAVLHEDAVFPVREAGIPINIRNTNRPGDAGTIITAEPMSDIPVKTITGIAGKQGFSTISIENDMMNSESGFGRKILTVLEENNIAFEHLTSGIDSIGIIVATKDIKDIKNKLIDEIIKTVDADTVAIEDNLSLIAVVGLGMIKEKGTAAKVFDAISSADVNVKMIDQGSSELNIIIGVDDNDYITTLNAIYDKFN